MSVLEPWRKELRARLGTNCFLHRDQAARALFVCDYPRRCPQPDAMAAALTALGYTVESGSQLWRIDLSPARREQALSAFSPHPDAPLPPELRSLCRSLRASPPPPLSCQPWPPLRTTLLLLDAGFPSRLFTILSAEVAVRKRTHAPLPAAAANIIEEFFVKERSKC